MPKILHFLFSTFDQTNIEAASFTTQLTPYSNTIDESGVSALALRIDFTVINPSLPVKIYPLFPGSVTFIASSDDMGIVPDPTANDFDNTFDQWKKKGSLLISLSNKEIVDSMKTASNQLKLPVQPNIMWIHGIELTRDFLFTTLKDQLGLEPGVIKGRPLIRKTNPNWYKYAISKFIAGTYTPELKFSTTSDTHYQYPLPAVSLDSARKASVIIELAYYRPRSQDTIHYNTTRNLDFFSTNYFNTPTTSSAFEGYGIIPVDLAYRELASQMEISMNTIWPLFLARVRNYYIIRFTRTFSKDQNYSIYFPQQVIEIKDESANSIFTGRLQSHGILFLNQMDNISIINMHLTGDMTWLTYSATAWKEFGHKNAIPITVDYDYVEEEQLSIPHILLRNTMSHEMRLDTSNQAPGGWNCTYISMRRFIRAFLNNRITGGRLLQELKMSKGLRQSFDTNFFKLSEVTKSLLQNTCAISAEDTFLPVRTDPKIGGKDLLPVFKQVFSEPASTTTDITQGFVAFNLWQSNYPEFNNSKSALFNDDHVGKGGPGAIVYLGLATYQIPVTGLAKIAGESNVDFTDRNTRSLLAGIQNGTVFQYWYTLNYFSLIQDRTKRTAAQFDSDSRSNGGGGHSPVFWELKPGNVFNGIGGIWIMDQGGKEDVDLVKTNGKLRIGSLPIWIGSKWLE
jgi:hypothetical protein